MKSVVILVLFFLIQSIILASFSNKTKSKTSPPHGTFQKNENDIKQPFSDKTLTEDELDICEAVFNHQFTSNSSVTNSKTTAYCLTIYGKTPSETFIKRFSDHKIPVKKGTDYEAGKTLLFDIYSITMLEKHKAEVICDYYINGSYSNGRHRYILIYKDKWQVDSVPGKRSTNIEYEL